MLETYKVESTLCQFFEKLITLWRTKLNLYTDNETITPKELFIWSVNVKPVETMILDDFPQLPHDNGYKYLGILESLDFHTKEVKITATNKYI
eukprot:14549518-Ditylum_brightwellii.AAC.1